MIQARLSLLAAGALLFAPSAIRAGQPEEPVNINTAGVEELAELPLIGEVIAARIVEWRNENGPFSKIEELMNVTGIGERTFERLRPHVTVGDSGRDRSGLVRRPVERAAA